MAVKDEAKAVEDFRAGARKYREASPNITKEEGASWTHGPYESGYVPWRSILAAAERLEALERLVVELSLKAQQAGSKG